ncbi:hypothetical protein E2562_012968 [Oryza meyeriana var. granulata]|uniref:Uncharacterized protein n=1 Tax=Oryza meyeriana var. granulata TaxID=110450 RepID=A0A6G1DHW8_9ORYZ|nr:hypothetical protein E2562_012968 [Oryza meyeriana var. granulata]
MPMSLHSTEEFQTLLVCTVIFRFQTLVIQGFRVLNFLILQIFNACELFWGKAGDCATSCQIPPPVLPPPEQAAGNRVATRTVAAGPLFFPSFSLGEVAEVKTTPMEETTGSGESSVGSRSDGDRGGGGLGASTAASLLPAGRLVVGWSAATGARRRHDGSIGPRQRRRGDSQQHRRRAAGNVVAQWSGGDDGVTTRWSRCDNGATA